MKKLFVLGTVFTIGLSFCVSSLAKGVFHCPTAQNVLKTFQLIAKMDGPNYKIMYVPFVVGFNIVVQSTQDVKISSFDQSIARFGSAQIYSPSGPLGTTRVLVCQYYLGSSTLVPNPWPVSLISYPTPVKPIGTNWREIEGRPTCTDKNAENCQFE